MVAQKKTKRNNIKTTVLPLTNKPSIYGRLFLHMHKNKTLNNNARLLAALKNAQAFIKSGSYELAGLTLLSAFVIYEKLNKQWKKRHRRA